MYVKKNFMLWLAVFAMALPLLFVSTASAMYMSDGAVSDPTGTAGWITPNDMVCILGVHTNGALDIVPGVTVARDCIYYNTGLTGMNPVDVTAQSICAATNAGPFTASCATAANCKFTSPAAAAVFSGENKCYDTRACLVPGAVGNDGAKHAVASSICVDGSGNGISLKDMDRTFAMCAAKGGTWKQTTDSTYVVSGVTTTQVHFTPGFGGACIAYGRQFAGQNASGTPLAFGAKGTVAGTNGQGYCYTTMNMTTAYGTAALCPSNQAVVAPFNANAAYDWAFASSKCTYAKGIAGYINAALTKADGTLTAAGTYMDLSLLTTMGDCLAAGASWNNWVGVAASTTSIPTTPIASTIPAWDYTRQAPDADKGCLHCHSTLTQYNGPAERMKDSYLKTGHKNMLRKVVAGQLLVGPDGVPYANDGTVANTINWSATPQPTVLVSGVPTPFYYVWGDWMIAAPTLARAGNVYGCGACHTAGFRDNTNPGVQSLGTPSTNPGYVPAQPADAGAAYVAAVTPGHKWDLEGIQCARCHNAAVGPINAAMISASSFTTTAPTNGGMGALPSGTGRNNLCFGCHQSIAKAMPSGAAQFDPTLIPTGVSHGAAAGRDFNGHVLGNSFLNSVHGKYAGAQSGNGSIKLNSLGKFDLTDPNGTTEYGSIFKGYTCWQSPTTNSPGKTKADGTEIKTKADCETLYGAGSWRADASGDLGTTVGSCTTCHDVHNSLFVPSQAEAALRKTCDDCHVNNAATGATDALAPQVAKFNHPTGANTPFDTAKYDSACVVCHMATQAEANGNQNSMPVHVWRINTSASYNTFPTMAQFYSGSCSTHTGAVQNAPYVPVVYLSDISSAQCTTPGVAGTWTAATKNQNAQTAPDGTYANAVWVDLDMACGQCHGGSLGAAYTANSAPYFDKTYLSTAAANMHVDTPGAHFAMKSSPNVNYRVQVDGSTSTCPTTTAQCTGSNFAWDFGDSTTVASGITAGHTYVSAGTYTVTLTVTAGSTSNTKAKSYTTAYVASTPTSVSGLGVTMAGFHATANWTVANGVAPYKVQVSYGNGTVMNLTQPSAGAGTWSWDYVTAGTYTVKVIATDSGDGKGGNLTSSVAKTSVTISASASTVSGLVTTSTGVPISGAAVTLTKLNGVVKNLAYTDASGNYLMSGVIDNTYTLKAVKSGVTFPAPVQITTSGVFSAPTITAITP